MALRSLTGAQGFINIDDVLWADASFDFKLTTSTASHPRSGKRSDLNLPGKLSVSISAKNIQRSANMIGGQMGNTAQIGTAGTIDASSTIAANGWIDMSDPVIVTASRIRVTLTGTTTVAGVLTFVGTDINGNVMTEQIPMGVGLSLVATGRKAFKTVVGYYNTGLYSALGTLAVTSIVGTTTYDVTTVNVPFELTFGGIEASTGNEIVVVAKNCFTTASGLAAADAGTIFSEIVSFVMDDVDADLSISDVVTG